MADRKIKIKSIESAGGEILNDDFVDNLGNPTDGNSGRFTYSDVALPDSPKRKLNRAQLQKEIRDKYIRENNIEEIA